MSDLSNEVPVDISVLSRRTVTLLSAVPSPYVYAGAQAGLNGPIQFTATVNLVDPTGGMLNPPTCLNADNTTRLCWNGDYPTGKLAIWEVTAGGAHMGAEPLVQWDLVVGDHGVKTFTTPANYEILRPGRHFFRAEYYGKAPCDMSTPVGLCPGPVDKQTVTPGVSGYYGSQSGDLLHDVHLSGLIGIESVTIGSLTARADSFSSAQGGFPATLANNARVLSNGTITIKGAKIFGNILSANGNVVLEAGSVITGNVTAKSTISGPGIVVNGFSTTPNQGSALMTPPLVPIEPCAPMTAAALSTVWVSRDTRWIRRSMTILTASGTATSSNSTSRRQRSAASNNRPSSLR